MTDANNHCVQVFDCKGQFLSTLSKKGAAYKQLSNPCGICVGSAQLVYMCDHGRKCVAVTSGEFVT